MNRRTFVMAALCGMAPSAAARAFAPPVPVPPGRSVDAATFGFAPDASGIANAAALQKAAVGGGTIAVTRPGTYRIAATVRLGDDTTLTFGPGVVVRKVAERGAFTHVFLNKGAVSRTYNHRSSGSATRSRVEPPPWLGGARKRVPSA